jgi:hypothetical protein
LEEMGKEDWRTKMFLLFQFNAVHSGL